MKKNITIRFAQCDPAGILFFANIFDICHQLFEELLEEKNISYQDWFSHSKWAYPIFSTQADFKSPLKAGQTYQAITTVSRVQESSFEMTYQFVNDNSQEMATAQTVHICINRASGQKSPIPSTIKETLK